MKPYQERAQAELAELQDMIRRLTAFIGSDAFATVESRERELLYAQRMAMNDYASILGARVRRWEA